MAKATGTDRKKQAQPYLFPLYKADDLNLIITSGINLNVFTCNVSG
jgi:hypothetical protein